MSYIVSIVDTTVTIVGIGGGTYVDPLTILATGAVEPTAYGAVGVDSAILGASLTNEGLVIGGSGAQNPAFGNAGIGVNLYAASTVCNSGTIAGGAGGNGADIAGGAQLTNFNDITGGASEGNTNSDGGVGAYLSGGTLINAGQIAGGGTQGNLGNYGGAGDFAKAGTVVNGPTGYIFGGYTADGVDFAGAMLTNQGTILGGGAEPGSGSGQYVVGGAGVNVLNDASVTNTGSITGGYGRTPGKVGDGVILNDGVLTPPGSSRPVRPAGPAQHSATPCCSPHRRAP